MFCLLLRYKVTSHRWVLPFPLIFAQTWQPPLIWAAVARDQAPPCCQCTAVGQVRPLSVFAHKRAVAEVLAAPPGCVPLFIYLCLLARWKQKCCLPSKVRSLRPCLDVNDALGEFGRGGGGCCSPPSYNEVCVCLWSESRDWWPLCCLERNDEWDC